ncbi:aggregation-promoting factor C-terminal-like domain-containing protein [Microbacterium saperdae]
MSRPALQVRVDDDPKVESLLHLHNTRASRRAAAAVEAHSAVRARRPMLLLSSLTGALLGITLTVGIVSAPAAGAENPATADLAAAAVATGPQPLREIADDAAEAYAEATDAVSAAEALTTEVAASGLDLGDTVVSIDTSELQTDVDALADRALVPALLLEDLTSDAVADTSSVVARTTALQETYTTAKEQKAAAEAAAAAEKAAAEKAAAAAAALASANTVDGAKATAREMASSRYGWGDDQFSCLSALWTKESGWNYQAYNADGGATGIPQALPGSKMAAAGSDWQTNAATQIAWGLEYIAGSYGSPCSAWSHSQAMNWY